MIKLIPHRIMHPKTSPTHRRRALLATSTIAALLAGISTLDAADLTWTGAVNANWNTTTANWTGGASAFTNGDNVSFTDTGLTAPTVAVQNTVTSVTNMSVSNTSGTYAINLTANLTGTSLTKSGAGTLAFDNTSTVTFSSTTLNGGTLRLRQNIFNGGAISVTGNTTVAASTAATTTLAGTSLTGSAELTLTPNGGTRVNLGSTLDTSGFTGTIKGTTAGQINAQGSSLNLSQAKVDLSGGSLFQTLGGTLQTGQITADSSAKLGAGANAAVTHQIGALNTNSSIAGVIQNGGISNSGAVTTGIVSLNKVGTGDLLLTGANTHTGTTTVNAGALLVGDGASGSITSALTVNAGAFYGNLASGNVTTGAVTIGNGNGSADAAFGAGRNTIGRFASSAGLSILSDANFVFDVNSSTKATDNVAFGGTITLGGVFTLNDLNTNAVNWSVNDSFTVLSGASVSSTFTNLANGGSMTVNGVTYEASYSATSLLLTVTHISAIPEPASAALLLGIGGVGIALRRRRV